ncbi:hypothetical protein ABZ864_25410 [Streptomyces sp. NPDC047082]|uniref:hypothetical protein n=1 Tax=Streptomyces sp. NPDC047082 TaxID=3155259 RepID=UPI00340BAC76
MELLSQLDTHVLLMTVAGVIRLVAVRVLDLAALALVLRGSRPEQRAELLRAFTSYGRGRASSFLPPLRFNRLRRRRRSRHRGH